MTTSKPPTPTLREAEDEFSEVLSDYASNLRDDSRAHVLVAARSWVAAARASALPECWACFEFCTMLYDDTLDHVRMYG